MRKFQNYNWYWTELHDILDIIYYNSQEFMIRAHTNTKNAVERNDFSRKRATVTATTATLTLATGLGTAACHKSKHKCVKLAASASEKETNSRPKVGAIYATESGNSEAKTYGHKTGSCLDYILTDPPCCPNNWRNIEAQVRRRKRAALIAAKDKWNKF